MKIERICQEASGTIWVYGSYTPRPVKTSTYKRRRHHKRKNPAFPTWFKILTVVSILILAVAVITDASSINPSIVSTPAIETKDLRDYSLIEEIGNNLDDIKPNQFPIEDDSAFESTNIEECIGRASFTIGTSTFTSLELPDVYYPGIDFSSFQPYESYTMITNTSSASYAVARSDRAYSDENGLRRYSLAEDQFSIDGKDDYMIALGTFYKPKGTCGQRYLIVTTTGCYTAIAGDEKADIHTDDMHMFSLHCDDKVAGIIEWIVDTSTLNTSMKRSGNIATPKGPVEELKGEILYIYLIEE